MTRKGRPTDNPKPYRLAIRLDADSREILERYCEQEGTNRNEAVRRGIQKLDADIKK
nr:MAG TPA: hypothetical protein [Caudoviricetes sp.]